MSWIEKTIGEIAEIISGQSPPSETYNEIGDGLPFFQGKADFQEKYPKIRLWCNGKKVKIAQENDILISVRAPVGPVNICNVKSCIGRGLSAIRIKRGYSNEYLYYFLKLNQQQIEKHGVGSTFKAITQNEIKKIKILLPPLEDQIRIASVLDKAEALINQRKGSIQLLDQLLRDTYLSMFGGVEKVNVKPLSSLAEVVSGLTKGKKYKGKEVYSIPYMRVANVQDGYLNLNQVKEIEATENEINRYLLKYNDLLLTEGGDPDKLGRGALWKNTIPRCIHQNHIFRVRITSKNINPTFLSFQTGSDYGKRYFLRASKQTTGIASINSTQLKNFPVFIPPLNLQNKFAAIVEKVEKLEIQFQKSLSELEKLNGSLSQKAFNTKSIDIKNPFNLTQGSFKFLDTHEEKEEGSDTLPFSQTQGYNLHPKEPGDNNYGLAEGDENSREQAEDKKLVLWKSVSAAKLAEWLKEDFKGCYFTSEMIIRYLEKEKGVVVNKNQPLYYSSEEMKKKPSLDPELDLKKMLFDALEEKGSPFLSLDQIYYDAKDKNFELSLRKQDYELLKNKSMEERSGIYLLINE